MKILYCNGDSWSAGDEIPCQLAPIRPTDEFYGAWPWHLAESLDMVCVNEAVRGSSNHKIYRRTTDYIFDYIGKGKAPSDLTIVVGWSFSERGEIFFENEYISFKAVDLKKNVLPDPVRTFGESYFQLYDADVGKKTQLRYMISLRMLCKNLGIKYFDFVAIGEPLHELHTLALKIYNIQLDNFLYKKTWELYCYERAQGLLPFGHPDQTSHKNWAKFLEDRINEYTSESM